MSNPWYDWILPVDNSVDKNGSYPHFPQGGLFEYQFSQFYHRVIHRLSTPFLWITFKSWDFNTFAMFLKYLCNNQQKTPSNAVKWHISENRKRSFFRSYPQVKNIMSISKFHRKFLKNIYVY